MLEPQTNRGSSIHPTRWPGSTGTPTLRQPMRCFIAPAPTSLPGTSCPAKTSSTAESPYCKLSTTHSSSLCSRKVYQLENEHREYQRQRLIHKRRPVARRVSVCRRTPGCPHTTPGCTGCRGTSVQKSLLPGSPLRAGADKHADGFVRNEASRD